jgi:hypothetical protein
VFQPHSDGSLATVGGGSHLPRPGRSLVWRPAVLHSGDGAIDVCALVAPAPDHEADRVGVTRRRSPQSRDFKLVGPRVAQVPSWNVPRERARARHGVLLRGTPNNDRFWPGDGAQGRVLFQFNPVSRFPSPPAASVKTAEGPYLYAEACPRHARRSYAAATAALFRLPSRRGGTGGCSRIGACRERSHRRVDQSYLISKTP